MKPQHLKPSSDKTKANSIAQSKKRGSFAINSNNVSIVRYDISTFEAHELNEFTEYVGTVNANLLLGESNPVVVERRGDHIHIVVRNLEASCDPWLRR